MGVYMVTHVRHPKPMNTSPQSRPAALRAALSSAGALALLSAVAMTPGCVVAVRPMPPVAAVYAEPQEVVVTGAPPAPAVEYVGVAPGPAYLWIGGYYHWYGGRWIWYPGHYERTPRAGARWIPPPYEMRGGTPGFVRGDC